MQTGLGRKIGKWEKALCTLVLDFLKIPSDPAGPEPGHFGDLKGEPSHHHSSVKSTKWLTWSFPNDHEAMRNTILVV